MKRIINISILSILLIVVMATSSLAERAADFGKQWVRSHQFTLTGLTQQDRFFSPSQYSNAGLGTFLAWKRFDELLPKAVAYKLPWHGHVGYDVLNADAQQLVSDAYTNYPGNTGWMVNDEPTYLDMAGTADVVNWIKQYTPDSLVYTSGFPWGAPNTEYYGTTPPGSYNWSLYLDDIISIIQPDVLCYDYYPFGYGDLYYGGMYYYMLMEVRSKALAANIPYWAFIQSFQRRTDITNNRLSSESDLRMQLFTMLTAGYKGLHYFTYDHVFESGMLDPNGTQTITYDAAVNANPEVINLGQSLRFLLSTDVRFVPGRLSVGSPNPIPTGLSAWSSGAGSDVNITDVSVDFAVAGSEGEHKDGLIGFFTDDSGEKYFMLTNAYQRGDQNALECDLSFVVQFDSGTNELLRLKRLTGEQETVALTSNTLNVTLPGGTGDLFKYNTGDFVGVESQPEPNVVTFQYGSNGYTAAEDGYVRSKISSSGSNFGGNIAVAIDGNSVDTRMGLMKWGDLFGAGLDQIPVGNVIEKATLQLYYWYPLGTPNAQALYARPLLVDVTTGTSNGSAQPGECSWDYRIHDTNGWGDGTVGTGPIADTDYNTSFSCLGYLPAGDATDAQWVEIDVTDILNGWASGSINIDNGFVIVSSNDSGGYFYSSDDTNTSLHPKLVVEHVEPYCGSVLYPYLKSDLSHDCYVDFTDFALFVSHWLDCTDPNSPCSYLP